MENEITNYDEHFFETESYCFSCGKNGVTRLLPLEIPLYKSIMVSSFCCENCGYSDKQLQSIEPAKDYGVHYELRIKDKKDLSRMMIRHAYSTVAISELEFESPPTKEQGCVTTVDKFIMKCRDSICSEQEYRKTNDPQLYEQLESFILKLTNLLTGDQTFTIIVDDPSGNSYIENPYYPSPDSNLWTLKYKRSIDENKLLNLNEENPAQSQHNESSGSKEIETLVKNNREEIDEFSDLYTLQGSCFSCGKANEIRMQKIEIPHFKEVLLTSFVCDSCGYHSSNVKCCSMIADCGVKYSLKVAKKQDLRREVIKSDYCTIYFPDIDLTIGQDSFPGTYTTIDGLLLRVKEEILPKLPLYLGDSSSVERKKQIQKLLDTVESMIEGSMNFSMTLDDPTGNSFIQNIMAPDPDENLTVVHYKRSKEQNECFCLPEDD